MSQKKYVSLSKLSSFLDNLRNTFAAKTHKHTVSDLTDYTPITIDTALSSTSNNPVANSVLNEEFDAIATSMNILDAAIDDKADAEHTHDDRYYTETEVDTAIANSKNTWYSTCPTAANTAEKVVTTASGNFELKTGSVIYVLFTYASCANATLNVDGKGAKTIKIVGSNNVSTYHWAPNEVVGFVYDGTYFRMLDGQVATTTYYGVTKLSSSTSSTSTTAAATPSAVKAAYDLADTANTAATAAQTSAETAQTRADAAYDLADGKADTAHSHTVSDITDLDIATWDNNGLLSTEDKMQLDYGGIKTIPMSSDDGATWTATIDGIGALVSGMTFLFIPNRTSSSTSLTLNVNGLGDVVVRRKMSSGTATLCAPNVSTLFFANRPTLLMYDTATPNGTTYWIALEFTKPSASDLYGSVPVQNGGTYVNANTTEEDLTEARENLSVYSKAEQEMTLIYDSGEITEAVNSIAGIDISGYKNIQVVARNLNDGTNTSASAGSVVFTARNGTTYLFHTWPNFFQATSDKNVSGMAHFKLLNGWLMLEHTAYTPANTNNIFNETEGGSAFKCSAFSGGGLAKCTNELSTMAVTSQSQSASNFFGVGSRVMVWGCKA